MLIAALTLDYFVRADGRPVLAAAALVAFAGANIASMRCLSATWGWGIEGAAWASALAEMAMFFMLVTHWFSRKCSLR